MPNNKKNKALWHGCATALITPFAADKVDYDTYENLIERQIAAGVNALVTLGTTGEPPTLNNDEKKRLIEATVRSADGRAAVVVGVGGNNTAECVDSCELAYALGADAVLVVTPYYNKTSAAGLVRHFETVVDSSKLPVIVYNVPSRTNMNVTPDVMNTLARHENIVALKEASGNAEQIARLFAERSDYAIYSGSDDLNYIFMANGGEGVISVLSNLAPKRVVSMCDKCLTGDYDAARVESFALNKLSRLIFAEVNPIPIKAAMSRLGLCMDEVRLPLVPMQEGARGLLFEAMEEFGKIE